jgi:cation transport protein ChaC
LSASEREQSLTSLLRSWDEREPLWVFGYGSLIWHPEFEFEVKTRAHLHGYHRSLCLWSKVYRGTPERPGLVLGLEPGGSCQGVAFRIAAATARVELTRLWEREMVTGSYVPRWLTVRADQAGLPPRLTAIAFVMNRRAIGYTGELDRAHLIDTVRTAHGQRGSCADYLFTTVRCLAEYGIHDRWLAQLAEEVALGGTLPSGAGGVVTAPAGLLQGARPVGKTTA